MSEHKNTILAVVLSLLVIVGWQYFIGYPQMERQRQETQQQAQLKQPPLPQPGSTQSATPQPNAAQPATPEVPGTPRTGAPTAQAQAASREAAIASSPRIAIETPRLGGSIDLKGGRIDDLTLTQYREETDPKSPPIVLFSPSGAPALFCVHTVSGPGMAALLPAAGTQPNSA
jgi:YidC/Oxa1 family membrane protein insertase